MSGGEFDTGGIDETANPLGGRRLIPLPILVAPFSIGIVAALTASFTWPVLATEHPLVLIGLNSSNRYLLLTAANLTFWSFFIVAFLRLLWTDPFAYLLGRQYGDAALRWVEDKTGSDRDGPSLIGRMEGWFSKAAPLFIIVAPSLIWCVMAGAAKMRVAVFVVCNLVGTVGRLMLFWFAADAFRDELESLLEGVERFQLPLLAFAMGFGVLQTFRRRKSGELATPAELEDEIAEAAEEAGITLPE